MTATVQEKTAIVPLRISSNLVAKLEKAANLLGYKSRNQLMREAIEKYVTDILNAKIIEVREVSVGEAAKLIESYLSKHAGVHYVSDLAERLGIELKVAFKAVEKLTDEGRVRLRKH